MGFGHSQRGTRKPTRSAARGRIGARPRTTAVSCSPASGRSAGSPGTAGSRSATSTIPTPPEDLSRGRRAAGGDIRRPRRRWRRTAHCGCSGATRWWSTPVAKRCSSKRSRRCCAPTRPSPTRWWSGGRANAGGKRSSRSSQLREEPASGTRQLHEHCTAQLARFKAPKEFIFVEQVQRLGNGKADYRWAKAGSSRPATAPLIRHESPAERCIDCLVNVHFGETEQQPELDAEGPRRLLQGSGVDVRAGRPVRAARRDGRARRAQGDPDGQPGQAVGDGAQVRRGQAGPVRAGDGRGQSAAADAAAARAERRRHGSADRVCRCGTELLGRRPVSAQRRRLLSALHQVRRAGSAAVRQHRHSRTADPR